MATCLYMLAPCPSPTPPQVLLAGGFARSPYLQRRVKEAFYGQTVIVPGEPGAAVVMGERLGACGCT